MSSATPAERATTARRLDYAMTDLEVLSKDLDFDDLDLALERLREHVDKVIEAMTRA